MGMVEKHINFGTGKNAVLALLKHTFLESASEYEFDRSRWGPENWNFQAVCR